MREIPTHLLYSQHSDHKADGNRMPDEYVAVDMMRINQGEPEFSVRGSFTSSANCVASGHKVLVARLNLLD